MTDLPPAPDFGPDFWAQIPDLPPTLSPGVSRETVASGTQIYLDLLRKWQAKINLVSPDSLPDSVKRHFLDSLQILPLLKPEDRVLVDMGSGAGFPGLALAVARPDLAVHMVESDAKKCEFMKTVSRETHPLTHRITPVSVHTARVEKLTAFPADVMTARALASLTILLDYALPFVRANSAMRLIFLKGETVSRETEDARAKYDFDLTEYPSLTDHKARVLVIENLKLKN